MAFTLDGKEYDETKIDEKGNEALAQIRQNFAKRDEYAKLHTGTFIIEEHFTKILRESVANLEKGSTAEAIQTPGNVVLGKPNKNKKPKISKKK